MSADDHQTSFAAAVGHGLAGLIPPGALKPGLTGSLWALGEDRSPE